jgi:hypothetical protein
MEDVTVGNLDELMSCTDCYAVTKKADVEKHYEWHERSVRDAVAASVVVVNDLDSPEAPAEA